MTTTFHVEASELDSSFLKKIQSLFEDKKLIITVEEEMDTTEYLLSSETNGERLKQSIQEAKDGKLISVSIEDLKRNLDS